MSRLPGHDPARLLVVSWSSCALLSVLRCLGPRFGPLTLLAPEPDAIILRSRYLRASEFFGRDDDATIVERLRRRVELDRIGAVVANDEGSVQFLARNAAALSSFVACSPTARPETIQLVRDKIRFTELVARLGLPHPRTVTSGEPDESEDRLRQAALELQFPVVVKPADLSCGFGISRCADPAAMASAARALQAQGRPWLVQEYFEGADVDVCLVAQEGRIVRWTSRRGIGRKTRFGEPSQWWELRPYPELKEGAAKIVAELRWSGAFDLDCLLNPETGEWRILECNPRFGATTLADATGGVNLPEALALLALRHDVPQAVCSPRRFYCGGLGLRAVLGLGSGPRLRWNETYLPHVIADPGPEWAGWRRGRALTRARASAP